MKIVILGSLVYPYISPRSMRATELAKYFASIGHDVSLYGILGKFNYSEFSQQTGVKVKDYQMRWADMNSDKTDLRDFKLKVLCKLFGRYLEFPDVEYMWKIPSVLKREKDIDLLITIAVPFPIHWGAARAKVLLKSEFPKVWISDCGDPYMGNNVNSHPFYFKYLEKFWGKQTDYITIPIEESRGAYYPEVRKKIKVIPQGFDFTNMNIDKSFKGNTVPTFAYAGAVYQGYRDPSKFLEYLCSLSCDFKFVVYTSTPQYYESYKARLKDKLEIKKYIPRNELLFQLSRMDFLVNLLNGSKMQSPSKLIDYFLVNRPILDVSSAFTDTECENFTQFLIKNYDSTHENTDIQQYDIINVGNSFLNLYSSK